MSSEEVAEELNEKSRSQSNETRSRQSKSSTVDILKTEFIYYSAVLKNYVPTLSREQDKMITHLWMRKLFGPEYHSTVLKPKRNKYLLYLTITIYNDETYGLFKQEPPCGVLPELKEIPFNKDFAPAAWELEKQWTETLNDMPAEMKFTDCYLHDGNCPQGETNRSAVYDSQFRFYLWLCRPYIALLTDPEEKTTVARWVQLLCGIAPDEGNCIEMKELRNEYMEILLGYVHDLRVEGPFRRMPPFGPVRKLSMWYQHCQGDPDYEDPAERQAEDFLSSQPLPESGAFAYINVTGELFENNL